MEVLPHDQFAVAHGDWREDTEGFKVVQLSFNKCW